jgi:hypothetical protein
LKPAPAGMVQLRLQACSTCRHGARSFLAVRDCASFL